MFPTRKSEGANNHRGDHMIDGAIEGIGKFGFGLMRLPQVDGKIDIEQTKQMVDLFLDAGFTYFDTAWAYSGSEDAIRQALVERYPREKYQLATKMAAWINCETRDAAIEQFETSLAQTGAGYFDFYLLHNLGDSRTRVFDDFDLWTWIAQQKAAGTIKRAGFSFHADAAQLDAILTAHPEVDFVQLQINYADWDNPAIESRACYETARKHDVPIVIMEPVKGGMLANPPQSVLDVLQAAEPEASAASWALRFCEDLPGVITVLSGMSSVEQMEDNLTYMKAFNGLSDDERATLTKAREELAKAPIIPCTTCNYCAKVCPNNIGISGTFTAANILTLYDDLAGAQHQEDWLVNAQGKAPAGECIECGLCEEACPQRISIREELKRCDKSLHPAE